MRPAGVVMACLALSACVDDGVDSSDTGGDPVEMLSDLGLFEYQGDGVFEYAEGIVPYDLNTALFSDHALKDRAIAFPDGQPATYAADAAFDFPVGTVLIKSFSFPADLRAPDVDRKIIETRLLTRTDQGWDARPYVWDESESDAVYAPGGKTVDVTLIDESGETLAFTYLVPQKNQCASCHELYDDQGDRYVTPIGPKARHLARTNTYDGVEVDQLDHLAGLGLLVGLPDEVPAAYDFRDVLARGVDALSDEEAEKATRDWLDVNCAHCHNPKGINGVTTQLWLNHDNQDQFHLGVCKRPGSAGAGGLDRTYDVVPGDHEASILWYRMSMVGEGAMPPLGRDTTYPPASDLVARWIDAMEGDCTTP